MTTESPKTSLFTQWREKLEDLLKVKSIDELKEELSRLGQEITTEIQNFDIQDHLSPTAKARIKALESRYNEILKKIKTAQSQFDDEFSKNLKALKKKRVEAEKTLKHLKKNVDVQKKKVLKASELLKKKLNPKKNIKKAKTSTRTKNRKLKTNI